MIKQLKTAAVTAVVLGVALSVSTPVYAKKHHTPSCTTEAKKAGIKGAKEIHAYVKECKKKRAAARRAAKHHKKEMKKERKTETKMESK
jgi:hypothetical protein